MCCLFFFQAEDGIRDFCLSRVFFFKQKTAYEIMPSLVGSEMWIRDSSILWASRKPTTSRANSTIDNCIPRQRPRNGILFSLAYLIAAILPSIPRLPKPPGTRIPETSLKTSGAVSYTHLTLPTIYSV